MNRKAKFLIIATAGVLCALILILVLSLSIIASRAKASARQSYLDSRGGESTDVASLQFLTFGIAFGDEMEAVDQKLGSADEVLTIEPSTPGSESTVRIYRFYYGRSPFDGDPIGVELIVVGFDSDRKAYTVTRSLYGIDSVFDDVTIDLKSGEITRN